MIAFHVEKSCNNIGKCGNFELNEEILLYSGTQFFIYIRANFETFAFILNYPANTYVIP